MAEVGTGLAARRIMVYGVTGCGKTTTAGRLSARIGVPWYAIDDHTWDALDPGGRGGTAPASHGDLLRC